MERSTIRLAVVLGVALALIPAATVGHVPAPRPAADPRGEADPSVWGWVVARDPTATEAYTPAPKDRGRWNAGTITVERISEGRYSVWFDGIMPGDPPATGMWGTVRATALSSARRSCHVMGVGASIPGPGATELGDVNPQVECVNAAGELAGSAFTVSFFQAREHTGQLAYLWANDPVEDEPYPPLTDYLYDSADPGGITIDRTGTGRYDVMLSQLDAATAGNLQVTMNQFLHFDPVAGDCRIAGRTDGGTVSVAHVRCFEFDGTPLDARFYLTFTDGVGINAGGFVEGPAAYLFANKPSAASYQPNAAFRYSSAGTAPTIARSGVGTYLVKLPGMPLGGVAHVTAYGTGKSRCQLTSIHKDALPQKVGVRCFKPNGDPVDSQFYLTYAR